MGIEEVARIKSIFKEHNVRAKYLEHAPVITSAQAAETRGFSMKEGIKAIVFTNGTDFVVVDVPADCKVDTKKVALKLGWKKDIRMATHEEVFEKTGCEVGAVPPFGHKERIQLLVGVGVYNNTESSFNIGLRTHSARVATADVKKILDKLALCVGDFTKE